MTWKRILSTNLTKDWVFSSPVLGRIFRVKQSFSSPPPYGYWGYIGQAGRTLSATPEFANVRRLYPVQKSLVIKFESLPCWEDGTAIALKGINHKFSALGFSVFTTVDVWEEIITDNIQPSTEYQQILSDLQEIKKNTQPNNPVNPALL
jgi:hypothetical protein